MRTRCATELLLAGGHEMKRLVIIAATVFAACISQACGRTVNEQEYKAYKPRRQNSVVVELAIWQIPADIEVLGSLPLLPDACENQAPVSLNDRCVVGKPR